MLNISLQEARKEILELNEDLMDKESTINELVEKIENLKVSNISSCYKILYDSPDQCFSTFFVLSALLIFGGTLIC